MIEEQLKTLSSEIEKFQAQNPVELESFRLRYVSRKSVFAELFNQFKDIPSEEKKSLGPALNELKKSAQEIETMAAELGLAMTPQDLACCQAYFRDEEARDPTITEIKLLDTYWSDHCRHTTFLTELTSIEIEDAEIAASYQRYLKLRDEVYGPDTARPICLMDLALIGMKALRKRGSLHNLEESEEINAASIRVPVKTESGEEPWLIMFKNETHNHPTEIEPFGEIGRASCRERV